MSEATVTPQATSDPFAIIAQPVQQQAAPQQPSGDPFANIAQPVQQQPGFLDRLGVGGIISTMQHAMESGRQAHEEASKQFKSGDYTGALKTLGKALVVDPVTAELKNSGAGYVYNVGKGFVNTAGDVAQGDFAQATSDLTQTVAPFPKAVAEDAVNKNYPGLAGDATVAGLAALGAKASMGEVPEVADVPETTTPKPGIVRQVFKGKDVAQEPAQQALRNAVQASAEDAGVASGDTTGGIRTLLDDSIDNLSKLERDSYDTINKASGTDLKSLYDHASDVQEALDDPTNIAQRTALQKDLQTTQSQIADGEAQARENGIDPDTLNQAKEMTKQRYARENVVQKLFGNESVVHGNAEYGTPESLNVDAAIRAVENLDKPSKFAPRGTPSRLQQALGEDGAKALKQGLYDAQKAGQKAATKQTIAKWVAGSVGGVGSAYEALKGLLK